MSALFGTRETSDLLITSETKCPDVARAKRLLQFDGSMMFCRAIRIKSGFVLHSIMIGVAKHYSVVKYVCIRQKGWVLC